MQWNRVNGNLIASAHDSDIRIWDKRVSMEIRGVSGRGWVAGSGNIYTPSHCTRYIDITHYTYTICTHVAYRHIL